MAFNRAGAGYFRDQMANEELRRQEDARKQQEKQHSKGWWKRGLGQGLLGALPGIVTLNPIQAGAGAAAGFGGEAVNHFAFDDKQPGIAGNAAALASLGSGAATRGLFSAAAQKGGLGGIQKAGESFGQSQPGAMQGLTVNAKAAPMQMGAAAPRGMGLDAKVGIDPKVNPAMTVSPETVGANPVMGPPSELADPLQTMSQEELLERLRLMRFA